MRLDETVVNWLLGKWGLLPDWVRWVSEMLFWILFTAIVMYVILWILVLGKVLYL